MFIRSSTVWHILIAIRCAAIAVSILLYAMLGLIIFEHDEPTRSMLRRIVTAGLYAMPIPAVVVFFAYGFTQPRYWLSVWREHFPGRCHECGYDISATRSPRCPECGMTTHPEDRPDVD